MQNLILNILVTCHEPILDTINEKHCYLRTSEFTNRPDINQFDLGVVTYDDEFDSLQIRTNPKIKVILNVFPPTLLTIINYHLDHFATKISS